MAGTSNPRLGLDIEPGPVPSATAPIFPSGRIDLGAGVDLSHRL